MIGCILPAKIAPNGDRVGLLQFADDLLVFISTAKKSARGVREILDKFDQEARQEINGTKSVLMFSKGTPISTVQTISQALNNRTTSNRL